MTSQDAMIENQFLKDINPLVCGWENCAPGHFYGPTARSYWLLHYVTYGEGTLKKGETTVAVKAGQIFVIRPQETVFYEASRENPWHYTWIGFETGIALPPALSDDVVFAPHCAPVFESLQSHLRSGTATELLICAKIYELLSLLSLPDAQVLGAKNYVQRAQNYIQNRYMDAISVSHIAAQLGLERSYFCRIFKAEIGISPSSYIVNTRLAHATRLLLMQKATIEEIAAQCGYNDLVNFSRMFKRRHGVSPSQYRKQHGR